VLSSQAGTSIRCKCGCNVNVPSMRGLRDLEQVVVSSAEAGPMHQAGWGTRQAMSLGCLMFGGIALGFAVYLLATKPESPAVLAAQLYQIDEERLDKLAENMSLEDSFNRWARLEADGIALKAPVPPKLAAVRADTRVYHFRLTAALAVGIVALGAATACRFWPVRPVAHDS
jgi:hypothetical protein